MRVLWVFSGGMFKNGICVSQLDYYKRINKQKIIIDVVTIDDSSNEMIEQYRKENCNVYILPNKRKKILNYIKELEKLFLLNNYGIIHVHGSSTLLFLELSIAKKYGVPIRIAHSRNTSCSHPILNRIFQKKFDKSYNVALACGEEAGKWLFGKKEFLIFHNGKDLTKYKFNINKRIEYREKLGIDDEIAIGHVGVFSEQKNHEFLIEVFEKIHSKNENTKLFLFGEGVLKNKIEKKVERYNLQDSVVFMNTKNNIEDYIQAMDIMLFPSLFEGLPNVVLEWQASGIPIIMSDKITDECIVTNLIKKSSIEKVEKWIEIFYNTKPFTNNERLKESLIACENLKKFSFELEENTRTLEKIYEGKA